MNKGAVRPALADFLCRSDVDCRQNPNTANWACLPVIGDGFKLLLMRCASLLVSVLLASCASLEQQPGPAAPVGGAFYLSGRISVKYGDQAASGRISWQHEPDADDLLFSTPLGQGVAHIVRRDGMVTLTTSDQKVYQASDVESLTRNVLGWSLPLAGLPDWVRGHAAVGAPAQTTLDGSRRLAELRQSGWLVELPAHGGDQGLPARLRLSREDVEIRLAVDEWRAAP